MRRWTTVLAALVLAPVLAGCTTTGPAAGTEAVPPPEEPPLNVTLLLTIDVLSHDDRRIEGSVRFSDGFVPQDALWDWGDSTSRVDNPAVHVYREFGAYTVTAQAVHPDGGLMDATERLTLGPEATPDPTAEGTPVGPPPQPQADAPENVPLEEAPFHLETNGTLATIEATEAFDLIETDWGDGTVDENTTHTYASNGAFQVIVTYVIADTRSATTATAEIWAFRPHVVVGVADSGFNVYHEVYRRPDLTAHPCSYVQGYPCDIPALELTLDAPTWEEAFQADIDKWEAIEPGDRYWIPGTNIIGALCVVPYSWTVVPEAEDPAVGKDYCILDDTSMHGTGTTSSVLSENPDALLVVAEGKTTAREEFATGSFPVDVISHSWGSAVPTPLPCSGRYSCTPWLFEVTASGNEGAFPVVLDRQKSHPSYINVGAADAGSRSEPGYSGWKTMDYVSEYCRETAQTRSFTEMRDQYCGTSFSAPTFAGALSRVIYELRMQSGWEGSIEDGMVDPLLGVSMWDVRRALNHTATYTPEDRWDDSGDLVPLVAPWYQWGWGYFDASRVNAALACIQEADCPERPVETRTYMEALWAFRTTSHGVP